MPKGRQADCRDGVGPHHSAPGVTCICYGIRRTGRKCAWTAMTVSQEGPCNFELVERCRSQRDGGKNLASDVRLRSLVCWRSRTRTIITHSVIRPPRPTQFNGRGYGSWRWTTGQTRTNRLGARRVTRNPAYCFILLFGFPIRQHSRC